MPTSLPNVPIPESETLRLAALRSYDILDTLPEQAYDDITLLAAQVCSTPIALVSLVDSERQWFKSRLAFEVPELPRYVAFCAHAIMKPDEVLIVSDALADSRFADNILVTEAPLIRFYAGAPLVTSEGHALGTLCVIDRVPRTLLDSQLDALKALSRQVVAQLELRRNNAWLQRHNAVMKESREDFEQYEARLREVNQELHHQSFVDGLTGIYNRRAFDLHLVKAVADAAKRGDNISLVMLDVDHFKRFNDDFGHAAGDEVLRRVAQSIQSSARKNDIVARYGGEEFAVILPQTDVQHAHAMAERLRAAVKDTRPAAHAVTVSAGVATQAERASAEALIAAADGALYHAKERGRDRVCGSPAASIPENVDPTIRNGRGE
jgi:diguanylate cyclase (GGDEF)-like protein